MNITTNNYKILVPFLIIILVGFINLLIIKKFSDKQVKLILIFQLAFIITYFPIMERMSIWNWSIWPEDFNFPISDSFKADLYYTTISLLKWLSIVLFYSSVILFISEINKNVSKRTTRIMNWSPLINLYSLPISISTTIGKKISDRLIIGFWTIAIAIWIISRFIGLLLCYFGIDIYTPTFRLFIEQNDISEISSLHECSDFMSILTPPILFISGVFSIIITLRIKRSTGANTP